MAKPRNRGVLIATRMEGTACEQAGRGIEKICSMRIRKVTLLSFCVALAGVLLVAGDAAEHEDGEVPIYEVQPLCLVCKLLRHSSELESGQCLPVWAVSTNTSETAESHRVLRIRWENDVNQHVGAGRNRSRARAQRRFETSRKSSRSTACRDKRASAP